MEGCPEPQHPSQRPLKGSLEVQVGEVDEEEGLTEWVEEGVTLVRLLLRPTYHPLPSPSPKPPLRCLCPDMTPSSRCPRVREGWAPSLTSLDPQPWQGTTGGITPELITPSSLGLVKEENSKAERESACF